jgi:cytochrome b6-f complex iron-sulfur subunit
MNAAAVIALVIAVVVVLGAVGFLTAARRSDVRGAGALSRETKRRDRDAEVDAPATAPTGRQVERAAVDERSTSLVKADSGPPAIWVPPDEDALGVSRRQFLNRATVGLTTVSLATFGAASFGAFLWPFATGGFGGKVNIGKRDEVIGSIRANGGFFYAPDAKSWVTEYPAGALPKAEAVYQPALLVGMEQGLVAMWQKCPHLGCRVPECKSSQWFECPCHGSQYNRVGEKKAGPAPRGMDHWAIEISASGDVIINTTGQAYTGQPIGTNTTGQEAEGPHCV